MSKFVDGNGRVFTAKRVRYHVTETGASCIQELKILLDDSMISPSSTHLFLHVSREMVRLLRESSANCDRDIDTFIACLPKRWQMPIVARDKGQIFNHTVSIFPYKLCHNMERIKEVAGHSSLALAFEHLLRFSYFSYQLACEGRRKNNGWRH